MRKPESFFSIWLGNIVFTGLLIGGFAWYYAVKMYAVGLDITLVRFVPVVIISILLLGTLLALINWKITKGRF